MALFLRILEWADDSKDTIVYKFPLPKGGREINHKSKLIVRESQEAIFMMNGQALDIFSAGRYTLETQNIPKLSKFLNRATGDKTPFHCEVYFINKAEQMAIKWGTDSRVQFIEPTYGFPISIGASGEMILRADDSKKLLLKSFTVIIFSFYSHDSLKKISFFGFVLIRININRYLKM